LAARIPIVERLRARIEEIMRVVRVRVPLLGERKFKLTAEEGQVVGGGALIQLARQKVEAITTQILERRPKIIETTLKAIEEWRPGERVAKIVPPPGEGAAPGRKYKLK